MNNDEQPSTPAADFPKIRNTVEISGEAISSLHNWYVAVGLSPKPDGTFNKPSKEHRAK